MLKTMSLMLLAALALAACATLPGQDTSPDFAPDQPTRTETPLPPSGEAQDKPSRVELPEGAVLEFRRSGGFAGLNEVWTLYADGRLTKEDDDELDARPQEWQVAPEQVTALLEKIVSLGFFELPAGSEPGAAGVDRFAYSLTLSYNDMRHTASAAEGGVEVPEALWQAIPEVQAFLEAATK